MSASKFGSRDIYESMLRQPSLRRDKRAKSLLFVICLLGFHYQMFDIVNHYVEYDVSTKLTFTSPRLVRIPATYVCPQYVNYHADNATLAKRINSAFSLKDTLNYCEVLNRDGSYSPCEKFSDMKSYYTPTHVCGAFFEESLMKYPIGNMDLTHSEIGNRPIIKYSSRIVRGSGSSRWFLVNIGQNNMTSFRVRNSVSLIAANINITSQLSLVYNRLFLKYLPPPYKTMCVSYMDKYGIDKRTLLESCILNSMKTFPYVLLTTNGSSYNDRQTASMESEELDSAIQLCQHRYQGIECNDMEHELTMVAREYSVNGSSDEFVMKLYRQHVADSVIVEQPKMDLFSFTISTGGFLSLYLGLSVADFGRIVVLKLMRIHHKRIQRSRGHYGKAPKFKPTKNYKMAPSKMLFVILLACGCVVQCSKIVNIYFENPFMSETLLYKPLKVQLPSITICIRRRILMEKFSPKMQLALKNTTISELETRLTVKKLMEVTWQFEDLIDVNHTLIKSAHDLNVDFLYLDKYNYVPSINRRTLCFTLFSNLQLINDSKPDDYMSADFVLSYVGSITMKRILGERNYFFIMYHDGDTFNPYRGSSTFLSFDNPYSMVNYVRLSYDVMVKRKVQGHRKSTCQVYEDLGHDSKDDAVRECIINLFRKKHGSWPAEQMARHEKDGPGLDVKFKSIRYHDIKRTCTKRYSWSDCVRIQYRPEVTLLAKITAGHARNVTTLQLNMPYGVKAELIEKLKFQFVELISYLGSTTGLWLGLSFYSMIVFPATLVSRKLNPTIDFIKNYFYFKNLKESEKSVD
ncbi:hypothetical protein HDE_06076 [Halotydeus destructor]|nr:hypothetical protein HDE_06076 [Halotydeus destructor]